MLTERGVIGYGRIQKRNWWGHAGGSGEDRTGGRGCRGRRQPHLSLYLFPPKKRKKKKGFLKERVPADMKTEGGTELEENSQAEGTNE